MAKKNPSAPRTPDAAAESTAPAAPKARRAPAKRAKESAPIPSVANDRVSAMPEPAAQRVTPATASNADSVTFVGLEDQPTYQQIAEAAYHRYLNRGGRDGQDFDDWIEAERSLKSR